MKFARDINAFTDFENTVYTLNLDSNNQQKLELAFDVINEWMNNITFFCLKMWMANAVSYKKNGGDV